MAFSLIAYDKYLAKSQNQRISELTLLSFAFLGGTIGSGFAMLIFRHKTSKIVYLRKFWAIGIIQVLIAFCWFNY